MKTEVTDLRKAYPELSPDKDYPPLRFKSLKGRVSAALTIISGIRSMRGTTLAVALAQWLAGLVE